MVGFAAAGLAVSGYLTYLSLVPPTSCGIDDFSIFSCDEVIWSQYSHFCGIPVALLGLAWFTLALGLIFLTWCNRELTFVLLAWTSIGVPGVAGFVYTEVFLLKSICLWCTVAHIFGIAVFSLSIAAIRIQRNARSRKSLL